MATDYSDIGQELKVFEGQKRLAELLYKQNLQTPQGGMVGNIYVGASPWQFLGNLANQYVADQDIKDIEQKEMNAVKQDRLRDMLAMTEANQLMTGRAAVPATPEQYKMLEGQFAPRDDEGNLMPGTQYQAAKEAQAAIEPDQAKAIQRLLMGGKNSQAYAMELMKEKPNWDVVTQTIGGQDVKTMFNKNARNPLGTVMQYGPSSPNPELTKMAYRGELPAGGVGINPTQNGSFGQINIGQVTNDPRLFATAAVENPQGKNITSTMGGTAHGLFQINKGTFETVAQNTPELRGVTFDQFKADPKLQAAVGSKLHDINDQKLTQSGIQPDPITRQATWFTGNTGLAKAAVSPDAQAMKVGQFMTADQAKANPDEANKTVGQWRNDVSAKIAKAQGAQAKEQQSSKYILQAPQFANQQEADNWWADARKPLSGDSLKGVQGNLSTIRAADDYVGNLEKYSKAEIMANPNIRALVQGSTKNYLMNQKEAFKLGVLNKEDLPQIDAVVRNPTDIGNILVAKDALIKLARWNQGMQRDNVIETYQSNQKSIPAHTRAQLERVDQLEASAIKPKQEAKTPSQAKIANQGRPTLAQADLDLIGKYNIPQR